jgi:hypothetical protein
MIDTEKHDAYSLCFPDCIIHISLRYLAWCKNNPDEMQECSDLYRRVMFMLAHVCLHELRYALYFHCTFPEGLIEFAPPREPRWSKDDDRWELGVMMVEEVLGAHSHMLVPCFLYPIFSGYDDTPLPPWYFNLWFKEDSYNSHLNPREIWIQTVLKSMDHFDVMVELPEDVIIDLAPLKALMSSRASP